ncbi:MAG: hypothetical protein KDB27_28925 [Planctomycetales bacterium]|nr:hypothetical protein [Planctomycetales bacterium]
MRHLTPLTLLIIFAISQFSFGQDLTVPVPPPPTPVETSEEPPTSPSDRIVPAEPVDVPESVDAPPTSTPNAANQVQDQTASTTQPPTRPQPPRRRPPTQREFGRLARVPEMFGDFFGSSPSAILFGGEFGEGGEPDHVPIPGPGTGGAVVGRQKIGENGSPLPRDRVFFNYSYFDSVPFTMQGVDVNRFTPGIEKTFLDENASIELRFPFATTLESDIISDGPTGTSAAEFGNITMYLKALLTRSDSCAVGGGLGIALPTADSLTVSLADGTPQVVVSNEAVHLMPYIGMLHQAPRSNMFVQGFLQLDFDLNGNPVYADNDGGMERAGVINDVNYLFADFGIGWWIDGKSGGLFSSIVPTIELHYNRSLQDTDFITGGGFQIGNDADTIELLNLVVASSFYVGPSKRIGVGYATPLGGGFDQQFDGELRVTFDSYYGSR